jgi:hypothetical protein
MGAPDPDRRDEAERSARRLAEAGFDEFVAYLKSPWRIVWINLLAGVMRGLGFVIGAGALLSLAGYLLVNWLGQLPWVGDLFIQAGQLLEQIQRGGGRPPSNLN